MQEILSLPWNELGKLIVGMDEAKLKSAIEAEVAGKHRTHVLVRMHQRYSKLRTDRERRELLVGKP